MNSKYPYVLAVILGISIRFLPEIDSFLILIGVIYFFAGCVFGFFWPRESWRWGIWMIGPLISLTLLSVLFAGQIEVFIKKDLPILLIGLFSSCFGSYLLATFKNRPTKEVRE